VDLIFDPVKVVTECTKSSMSKPVRSHEEAQDVVQSMLTADLPPEQKTFVRVFGECRSIILAGTETTAIILTSITYHALANPEISARISNELKKAQSEKQDKLDYQDIRNLPYITAVIYEALRTSNPISGRLPRFSEVADVHYQQYFLPRGVCTPLIGPCSDYKFLLTR
jgi:cytochrome P450